MAITERRTGAYVVSTDSFTAQEVALLRSVLLNNFTIESTQVDNGKGKDQYSIYIPKREVPKLKERRAEAGGRQTSSASVAVPAAGGFGRTSVRRGCVEVQRVAPTFSGGRGHSRRLSNPIYLLRWLTEWGSLHFLLGKAILVLLLNRSSFS
jgi:hypothetical protein